MNGDFARRSLVVAAGIVLTALLSWSVTPGEHRAVAVAAIMRSLDSHGSARPESARNAASNAAVASKRTKPAAAASQAAGTPTQVTPRTQLERLREPMSAEPGNDPFTISSWLPPPPPPPPPPPVVVPPPTAPPLPFSYLGEVGENAQKRQVFLSTGERLLIVSLGDVIDGQYRIDSIATGAITFTYLPLNMKQVLSTQGEGK